MTPFGWSGVHGKVQMNGRIASCVSKVGLGRVAESPKQVYFACRIEDRFSEKAFILRCRFVGGRYDRCVCKFARPDVWSGVAVAGHDQFVCGSRDWVRGCGDANACQPV